MKVLFIFLFTFSGFCLGQQDTTVTSNNISLDSTGSEPIQMRCKTDFRVWKVQLGSSSSKKVLLAMQKRFKLYHRDMYSNIDFDSPYWFLRVGSFLTEQSAQDFIDGVRCWYPDAYPVRLSKMVNRK
jgi:hypothetical protein